ncbi:hypothetical protein [Streptomyces cavernae]|uniref:hypothetical protein n=1 Tax=Streptomyces cavernae TaxID=2259034 RepID=UPI000FEBAAEE|nr:hypothetical protein [Streptomyces cavernae]
MTEQTTSQAEGERERNTAPHQEPGTDEREASGHPDPRRDTPSQAEGDREDEADEAEAADKDEADDEGTEEYRAGWSGP